MQNDNDQSQLKCAPIDYNNLDKDVGYLLRRAQLWVFQDFIKTTLSHRIRPAQYAVLAVIEGNPGLSQITLACALGIERARLVRVLDQLEERKLVERRPAATDRRSHAMHLTDAGTATLTELKKLMVRHRANCVKIFGGEAAYTTMAQTLGKFCNMP